MSHYSRKVREIASASIGADSPSGAGVPRNGDSVPDAGGAGNGDVQALGAHARTAGPAPGTGSSRQATAALSTRCGWATP